MHFQLLSLPLKLVDELLLVVDLLAVFSTRMGEPLTLEVCYRGLALSDHLTDGLTLHAFAVLVHDVELLLALQIVSELLLHGLGSLHLCDIHIVAGVLHLLPPLFLALKSINASLSLLCCPLFLLHGLLYTQDWSRAR